MKYLTKEQQRVLIVVVLLLLSGLAVKVWCVKHPSAASGQREPSNVQATPPLK
jgi:hypothetical protein